MKTNKTYVKRFISFLTSIFLITTIIFSYSYNVNAVTNIKAAAKSTPKLASLDNSTKVKIDQIYRMDFKSDVTGYTFDTEDPGVIRQVYNILIKSVKSSTSSAKKAAKKIFNVTAYGKNGKPIAEAFILENDANWNMLYEEYDVFKALKQNMDQSIKSNKSKGRLEELITKYEKNKKGPKPIPKLALFSKYAAHTNDGNYKETLNKDPGYLKWTRSMSGYANWNQIEPQKGVFDWSYLDEYVRLTQSKDYHILLTISPFTDWDQEIGNMHLTPRKNDTGKYAEDHIYKSKRAGKPTDMEAFRNFITKLIERYDGDGKDDMPGLKYQIKYWEFCNEVDGSGFFQGTGMEYYEMLKEAYTVIKKADPYAQVLISSFHSLSPQKKKLRKDFGTVDELFEKGIYKYFDIMNSHTMVDNGVVREFLKKYNCDNKAIWVTEPGPGYEGFNPKLNSSKVLMERLNKEVFIYGVERVFGLGSPSTWSINIPTIKSKDSKPDIKQDDK